MSQRSVDEEKRCKIYMTFGDCQFGAKCERKHTGTIPNQEFFFTRIEHKADRILTVNYRGVRKKFFVTDKKWFHAEAKPGDLVLFQSSHEKYGQYQFGRVVTAIRTAGKNEEGRMWDEFPPILTSSFVEAYTFDPVGTKRYDDALSMDKCSDRKHSNCTKVGIHVSSVALANPFKIDVAEIPSFHSQRGWACPGSFTHSLEKDRITLALSIYFHTETGDVTEPNWSLVKVRENFSHGDEEQDRWFRILWKYFVKDTRSLVADRQVYSYIAHYPILWKQNYLVRKIMEKFQFSIKNLCLPSPMLLTRVWIDIPSEDFSQGSVTVFKDFLESNDRKNTEQFDNVLPLVAASLRFKEKQDSKPSLLLKYRWTAESFDPNNRSNNVVPCTSPLRDIRHYVNQQIVTHRLLGSEKQCYSQRELLGILGIRFETSNLSKAYVKKIGQEAFKLEYLGKQTIPRTLHEPLYADLTLINVSVANSRAKVTMKSISCPSNEYCNRPIVHLQQTNFAQFFDSFAEDPNILKDVTQNNFTRLLTTGEIEENSPYERSGEDTILTLKPGVELQIQISKADGDRNHPLKWRMLRVGKNCHVCITHKNSPELAFMSKREDVQTLVSSYHIEHLQKKSTSPLQANRTKSDVEIQWSDRYYSGGSFDSNSEVADRGTLLCIRKEIYDDRNVKYIWCCHGVVSAKKRKDIGMKWKMLFEVCTLSQTEAVSGPDGFTVEFISVESSNDEPGEADSMNRSTAAE